MLSWKHWVGMSKIYENVVEFRGEEITNDRDFKEVEQHYMEDK